MAHDQYVAIKAINERLLAQLDEDKSKNEQRKADAHRALSECDVEDSKIEEKRNAILQAEALQLAYLDSVPPPAFRVLPPPPVVRPRPPVVARQMPLPPPPASSAPVGQSNNDPDIFHTPTVVQRRARVGPQRYFILTSLRSGGPLTVGEIIKHTGFPERRIRDQLRSDIHDGVIDEVVIGIAHKYRLTKAGAQLLVRFEEYRKSTGKGLPTPEDARSENTRPTQAGIFN
jgi:hypothetical protein